MKTKLLIIITIVGVFAAIFISGPAPLVFSELVYGCNLQQILATGDIEQVTEHEITQQYLEKYNFNSVNTSRSRSLEWGYGTVEYSSYFRDVGEGWSNANLKITIDQCGIPQEFEFQCVDSKGTSWIFLNSKKDNVLEYLQNQNCFEVKD